MPSPAKGSSTPPAGRCIRPCVADCLAEDALLVLLGTLALFGVPVVVVWAA